MRSVAACGSGPTAARRWSRSSASSATCATTVLAPMRSRWSTCRRAGTHPFISQYLIRADGDLLALARAAERELAALDGGLVLENATLLTEVVGQGLAGRQLPTVLIGAFGALALLLASVGVYAMFVSMVAAREGEFAVRMALGSRPAAVARLVLRQGAGWLVGRTRRRRRRARVGRPAAAGSALRRIAVRPSCARCCDRGACRVRGGGAADTAAPRDVRRAGRRAARAIVSPAPTMSEPLAVRAATYGAGTFSRPSASCAHERANRAHRARRPGA